MLGGSLTVGPTSIPCEEGKTHFSAGIQLWRSCVPDEFFDFYICGQ